MTLKSYIILALGREEGHAEPKIITLKCSILKL
jgi:hypothetical protein